MDWDVIRRFFRESPQGWIVLGAAVLTLLLVVWGVYGNFQFEIGRFFAAEERCPGRASQPPDWVPDFVCNREPEYDYALDQGCLPTYKGSTGTGEFLYLTDRRPEPDSGVEWERYPKMCVEKPQDCPKNWVAFADAYCIRTCDPRAGGSGCTGTTDTQPSQCPAYSGTPMTPVLSVQCGSPSVLSWTNPLTGRAMQNVVQRMDVNGGSWTDVFSEGGCWNTFGIGTYSDATAVPGRTYQYRVKFTPSIVSNTVLCGGAAIPSTVPTTNAPPTPPPPPLVCSPTTQSVQRSAPAVLQAAGGTGVYQWDITGGGVLEAGGNESVTIIYAAAGTKTVRVNSGAQSARCTVVVSDGATPTGTASLTVTKYGRNLSLGDPSDRSAVTVNPGQIAEFVIRVTNTGTGPTSGLLVRDELPVGMSYRAGSTTVEGQTVPIDTITTSGLFLGRLEAGDSATIRWSAIADQTSQFPGGPQFVRPRVTASAQQLPEVFGDLSVTVYGGGQTGTTGSPGTVQTGPGDAVIAALMFAAALTLLYTAYTRSPVYRRREAVKLSEDQGPLDFRS
ncbi:MAG: DUF11 domain-containing protein [Candidatus Yanofskybacteria bacterium]|nr:DUF11 domain-containing protein [Candidatus Yanofskybacteria bacterium]